MRPEGRIVANPQSAMRLSAAYTMVAVETTPCAIT